ncbi:hypothetical protein PR048_010506 [Dryococelus australis]|uniref:Uncharacterized protein n=1 Tax=Dryococelus australis TaxID=614101 RepID=A0ABQ9I2Z4_9NEOP|nr:hypothetical protein PR048_010506 [Dryococelus australis]
MSWYVTQKILKPFFHLFFREGHLDHMLLQILKAHSFLAQSGLLKFVKEMLILSHGNATLECEFSLKCNLLTENLQEQSLIAQRQVYDYVHHCGGVEHVDITKFMLQYLRNASLNKLCKQKKKRKRQIRGRHKKERVQEEIKELQKKKA